MQPRSIVAYSFVPRIGWLLVCLSTIACGADDRHRPPHESGVDESKLASEVTFEEAQAICTALDAYAASKLTPEVLCSPVARQAALAEAAAGGDPEAACEAALRNCTGTSTGTPAGCAMTSRVPEGCSATVGQAEECARDLIDAAVDAHLFRCSDSIGTIATHAPPSNTAIPASCEIMATPACAADGELSK